jgi:hypothetical protein
LGPSLFQAVAPDNESKVMEYRIHTNDSTVNV